MYTALAITPTKKSPTNINNRMNPLMTGMMLTQFMPQSETCDFTKMTASSMGLVVGAGLKIIDTAGCSVKCAFECTLCIIKGNCKQCYKECERNTCGWIPEGQWARGKPLLRC